MELANALMVVMLIMFAPLVVVDAQTTVDWTIGEDYSSYSTQSFEPGATILFNYDSSHDVLVVSKSDYEKCVAGNPLQTFNDGKTSITLKQGTMYFICGVPGHCSQGGMKLQVTVGDTPSTPTTPATPTTPSTPATPTTPSTPTTPDTPTTPTTPITPTDSSSTTPSAPPPKNSNGATSLSSQLILGVALVLGTLFAIMG